MLTRRIIPCLDCSNGRVVKGIKFQGLRDAGDPVELARSYEEQGADELVLLDVSATPEGRGNHLETVALVRQELSIPLTVGGGVRTAENARALLEAGADKVGVNTAGVTNPEIIRDIAHNFGSQCSVVAIDAAMYEDGRDGWEIVIMSGKKRTGIDAIEWAQKVVHEYEAGEILLTSWDRDGTRSGYDLKLLKAVSGVVNVPVIASGGAASPEHLIEAIDAGADAVLAASIFHDGEYTVQSLKDLLLDKGVAVRP